MKLPKATLKDRLLLLFKRRRMCRVAGDSMLPTLKSGDIVVVDTRATVSVGDVVAADHPYKRSVKLIKRVESINSDGRYVLAGDNPDESSDSRNFGSIAERDIAGKVVCRI